MYKMTAYIIFIILEKDKEMIFNTIDINKIKVDCTTKDYKRAARRDEKQCKGQPYIPLLVDGEYNLLDGNCRFNASTRLNEEYVPIMKIVNEDGTYMNGDQFRKWIDHMKVKYCKK